MLYYLKKGCHNNTDIVLTSFPCYTLHVLYYKCTRVHTRLSTHKVVDCGAPNNPENGDVTFTLTVYNAIAVYSCDEGYNLVPSETFRTCQADGNWTEDDRACQRKYNNMYCTSIMQVQNWLPNSLVPSSLPPSLLHVRNSLPLFASLSPFLI